MSAILECYGELLESLNKQQRSFRDSHLCVFSAAAGEKYDNDLMVVGRATNGWGNGIDKTCNDDYHLVLTNLKKEIGTTNLDWVRNQWGATGPKVYNSKRSPFWRLIKALSDRSSGPVEWSIDHVVWSNLYKVARNEKRGTGNPTGKLMNLQFEHCAKILGLEIEQYKPRNVVFLTSMGWARRFLEYLEIENMLSMPQKYVEFAGIKNGVRYVVGQHPQGKPQDPHCDEIINALRTLPAEPVLKI
jgi:hypothetical protein